ncbi:heme NO-binding domain-containing protein [Ramlibacter sp. 2FC]|uniref:heme NO-binding domain-containing protein n=1 Tax=Ramlibacter sp. 2FC TaxID=2502188 RepID=UPI0010F92829|nr:heme NO-binding domain-containing protein [Ramlibacter sp. 2FC]
MNGIFPIEIRKFVEARLGEQAWPEIVRSAEVRPRLYVPVADYPDQEIAALLSAVSARTGDPIPVILEAMGEFIVPDLISMVPTFIRPGWKTLDMIANTEEAIHEVLRHAGTNTNPPKLMCRWAGSHEVVVTYTSPRKMCTLAKGIIRGIAKYYGEQVAITEPTCMLRGDAACQLHVTVI